MKSRKTLLKFYQIFFFRRNEVYCFQIFGRDAECMVRKWYLSNIIIPFNCTLPYLKSITKLPPTTGVCKPNVIADNYLDKIQYVWNSAEVNEEVCFRLWVVFFCCSQLCSLFPFHLTAFFFQFSHFHSLDIKWKAIRMLERDIMLSIYNWSEFNNSLLYWSFLYIPFLCLDSKRAVIWNSKSDCFIFISISKHFAYT